MSALRATLTITHDELLRLVPHRPPMLLLDRIDELVRGVHGRATKLLTEPLASTLVIDALGQVAIAVLSVEGAREAAVWYLASLETLELGLPARTGETLHLEASVDRIWKTTARMTLRASVPRGRDVVKGTMVLSNHHT
ncbi:MAG: hypothetical protein ABI779_05970 [Acidobacteriota bacterium]